MATYLDELVQKIVTKADLKGFDDLERKQKRAIKSNDLLAKSFRRAFGIFFGIQGVRSVIKTTREIDLLQRSIQGLTGTADDWQYLRREAYRTGTDLTKAAQAYKNFYSAANMAGFQKPQIQSMFSDVLVAGRGIGANQQQIGAALLALEQMLSKGKVSMEELRRQMGNALPGSFEIAAKSMGVTTQEFNKMLEAGLDSAEFVPKFTAMLRNELGKGFEANIKSLDFALVNLNTAWMEFQANILHGEAGEALAQLVRDITDILRSQTLLKFIQLIGKAIGFIIKHIRMFLFLFGVKKVIEYTMALKRLHLAIIAMSKSTAALGAVTRTLASGYAMMFTGTGLQGILSGIKMIAAGLWAMVAPTALIAAKFTAIIAGILLLQDVLLGMTDPNADTYFNNLMRIKPEDFGEVEDSRDSIGGVVHKDPYAGLTIGDKKKINKRIKKAWMDEGVSISAPQKGLIPWSGTTGQAAPLFNTELQTPSNGYLGTPPNLNGNYNSSDSKNVNNNLTINISAPNSQPDTIAQSVEDVLQKFFTKYEMSFA